MARSALPAWLTESIEGDILLAIHWLQRTGSSEAQIKSEGDGSWTPVYQDHGSYMEFKPCDDSHHLLQIIHVEESPFVLTLSDGHACIEATLTAACARDFSQRHPDLDLARDTLHSLLTVRRSTLRCATNGPPSSRLRLALFSVDWTRGPYHEQVGYPEPLVTLFDEKLHQLTALRARQTLKYAYTDPASTPDAHGDAMSRIPASLSQSFATQFPNLAQDHDAVSQHRDFTSQSPQHRTRVEGQSESTPGKVTDLVKGLLHKLRPRAPEDDVRSGQTATVTHNADGQPREGSDYPQHEGLSSMGHLARPLDQPISPQLGSGSGIPRNSDTFAAMVEEGWMRMYVFNDATTCIPDNQRACLSRPEAWQKPSPGTRAVSGNIPIEDLKRIQAVRERSFAKSLDSSGGNSLEMTQSSFLQDNSPAPESALGSQHGASADIVSEGDDSSQPIPWSSSPPEAPRPVAGPPSFPSRPELPPDSSCEPANHLPDSSMLGFSSARHTAQDDGTFQPGQNNDDDECESPHQTKIHTNVAENDDDDMEMALPQGLGEDLDPLPVSFVTKRTDLNADLKRPIRPLPKSTVQVEETPCSKAKLESRKALLQRTPSQPNQRSSGTSNETEIVYGTYKEAISSTDGATKSSSSSGAAIVGSNLTAAATATNAHFDATLGVPQAGPPSKREEPKSAPSPKHVKRRKLKHLKFDSEDSADAGDLSDEYRRERSRCLGKHHDPSLTRNTIIDLEGGNAGVQTDKITGVDARIVPAEDSTQLPENNCQHDFVIPAAPQNVSKHERVETLMRGTTEPAQSDKANILGSSSHIIDRSQSTVMDTCSGRSSLPLPLEKNSSPGGVQAALADNGETGRKLRDSASSGSSLTVFSQFQRCHPDYTGDEAHFASLCRKIYSRPEEVSPLPPSHWDDYIIKHCTLYRDYVQASIRHGEDPQPYHEWYGNQDNGPPYARRVLADKSIVKQAVEESSSALGAQTSGLSMVKQSTVSSTRGPLSAPAADLEIRGSRQEHSKSILDVDTSRFEGEVETDVPCQEHLKSTGLRQERSSLPAAGRKRIPSKRNQDFEAKITHPRSTRFLSPGGGPHKRDKEWPSSIRPLPEPGLSRTGKAPARHSTSSILPPRAKRLHNANATPSHRISLSAMPQSVTTAATPRSSTVAVTDEEDPFSARANALFGLQRAKSFTGSGETTDREQKWPLTLAARPAMPERKMPNVLKWHDAL